MTSRTSLRLRASLGVGPQRVEDDDYSAVLSLIRHAADVCGSARDPGACVFAARRAAWRSRPSSSMRVDLTRVLGPPAVIAREVARAGGASRASSCASRSPARRRRRGCWRMRAPDTRSSSRDRSAVRAVGAGVAADAGELAIGRWTLVTGPRRRRARSIPHGAPGLGTPEASAAAANPRAAPIPGDAIAERWHVRPLGPATLGDLAALPRADLHARLGPRACGCIRRRAAKMPTPLVPAGETPPFLERCELEWPIEGLEPLSFVLARLCDALSASLERADRGAVTMTTRLRLVTRATHERDAQSAGADARRARAAHADSARSRIASARRRPSTSSRSSWTSRPAASCKGRCSTRALPSPERLATLVARLGALMGETRVGAPVVLDTHDERAVAMKAFASPIRQRQ